MDSYIVSRQDHYQSQSVGHQLDLLFLQLLINNSEVPVRGVIIGNNIQTGAQKVFPYGTAQAPLAAGASVTVQTTFQFPTALTAINNNNSRSCFPINFDPSIQYTIISQPATPFCSVFSG